MNTVFYELYEINNIKLLFLALQPLYSWAAMQLLLSKFRDHANQWTHKGYVRSDKTNVKRHAFNIFDPELGENDRCPPRNHLCSFQRIFWLGRWWVPPILGDQGGFVLVGDIVRRHNLNPVCVKNVQDILMKL